MSKIVVFGASGYAGGHITSEAVARGHAVTAVARHIEPGSTSADVERSGSIHDPQFVAEVTEGADVIVVAVRAATNDDAPLIEAYPALVAISAATGARLAVVGGAGTLLVADGGPALFETPAFPEQAKAEAAAQAQILSYLRDQADDARWFYLSPAAQFGAWVPGERTGHYRTTVDTILADDDGKSFISGADYAIAMLDEIETPSHNNMRFGVAY